MTRALVVAVALLTACGATSVTLCRGHCDKRAECGQTIDLDACHRACADSVTPGTEPCVAAAHAHQECQLRLACAEYLGGSGCDETAAAQAQACQ